MERTKDVRCRVSESYCDNQCTIATSSVIISGELKLIVLNYKQIKCETV